MSAALTGAWIGAVLGLASFAALRWVAARMERSGQAQQQRSAGLMRAVAVADLVMFPIIGYFAGPMVLKA